MKKICNIYYSIVCGLTLSLSSCQDMFLDLEPQDTQTDAVYFKTAEQFHEFANSLYSQLQGWGSPYGGIATFMDAATDLSAYFGVSSDVGHGTIQVTTDDTRWTNCYAHIRTNNILLERAASYGDQEEIKQYVSEAYFFRAYNYFYLLQFFGGVPIVTSVLDVDSPELTQPRNSRYEVVNLILSDLDKAIEGLPREVEIPSSEKGRISHYGAEAFKARVLLYEATWRKYNGTSTDFEGSAGPEKEQTNEFLDEAIRLCKDVMDCGEYSIWNYNDRLDNMSSRYLFCLEDDTNPAGLTKTTNKEFIIKNPYDRTVRPGGINLNQTVNKMDASRKLMDMFLCTNGLPIEKSREFQGYESPEKEFENRDFRMKSYIDYKSQTSEKVLNTGTSGYGNMKWYAEGRATKEESADYPVLRLAEVYLIYAEALFERNGEIKNEQLDESINKLRDRAGIAHLSNELVKDNGLDMLEEIRRERAIELYMEGFRFDDLKRWGIAEQTLNESRLGMVVGNADNPTTFVDSNGNPTDKYAKNTYVWGEETIDTKYGQLNCVVVDSKQNFSFTKTHYLWPIPQRQINLNPNLKQNPGYNN